MADEVTRDEVAQDIDVAVSTLKYWETIGILPKWAERDDATEYRDWAAHIQRGTGGRLTKEQMAYYRQRVDLLDRLGKTLDRLEALHTENERLRAENEALLEVIGKLYPGGLYKWRIDTLPKQEPEEVEEPKALTNGHGPAAVLKRFASIVPTPKTGTGGRF